MSQNLATASRRDDVAGIGLRMTARAAIAAKPGAREPVRTETRP